MLLISMSIANLHPLPSPPSLPPPPPPLQSKDKMKRGSRRGCFQLKRAIIGIDDEDDSTFTIRVDNRIYHFQGELAFTLILAGIQLRLNIPCCVYGKFMLWIVQCSIQTIRKRRSIVSDLPYPPLQTWYKLAWGFPYTQHAMFKRN